MSATELQPADMFYKIIRQAGLKPWPRAFHNLRSSRATELTRDYPIRAVADWLGHDVKMLIKHYCFVTA